MKLSLEDKLKIIRLKESGHSISSLAKKFNIGRTSVIRITRQAREHGKESFKPKGKNIKYSPDYKLEIVNRVLNGESKTSLEAELSINIGMIHSWVQKYQKIGYNGLTVKQGRPKSMKIKNEIKKTNNELDEKDKRIKELEEKNSQLEMENDLLKKLRALVQQRTQQPKKKK